MLKKHHYIYTALIAALMLSACSSEKQEFDGRLKIERGACNRSGGSFNADEIIGKSTCDCHFENGTEIKCYQSWLCDEYNKTCRECVEGEVKCNKGEASVCVNGNWQNDNIQHKCPEEDIICESNKCVIEGKETEIVNTTDYADITEKNICAGDITCDGGELKCNDNFMALCITGECDGNKCKPIEGIAEGTICNQKNESQCVHAGNQYIQLQCVENIWIKTNDCEECSFDAKTCGCKEKDYPQCDKDKGKLATCQSGRIISKDCPSRQCKDDKSCADEIEPPECPGCTGKCENGVCTPQTPVCEVNETMCDGNILKKCGNEGWNTGEPCQEGYVCQENEFGISDCVAKPPSSQCESDDKCKDGYYCNPDTKNCECHPDEYKCDPENKGDLNIIKKCDDNNYNWRPLNDEEMSNWDYDEYKEFKCNDQNVCALASNEKFWKDVCGECQNDYYKCDVASHTLQKCIDGAWKTCDTGHWDNCQTEQANCSTCKITEPAKDMGEVCEQDTKSSVCEENSYLCDNHILKCTPKEGGEPIVVPTTELVSGCLKKDDKDDRYYCQNNNAQGTSDEACECTPNNPGSVYCFNDIGYFCNSDKNLENLSCICRDEQSDWNIGNITTDERTCYYNCEQYFCVNGILKCKNALDKGSQFSVNLYNGKNEELLDHCLNMDNYLCEKDLASTDLMSGKCCTPDKNTYLCFKGKAYECDDGDINEKTARSCDACKDKYGETVPRTACSASAEEFTCNDNNQLTDASDNVVNQKLEFELDSCVYDEKESFYLCSHKGESGTAKELCKCEPGNHCYGEDSFICSLEGELKNGKPDDKCCENSQPNTLKRATGPHCEGCLEGYYRCGPANLTTTIGIGDTSYAQRCNSDHWENDESGDTHVLGIVRTEVTPLGLGPYYRLFDCFENNDSVWFDKANCKAFSINKDNSNIYDVNNPDGIKILYDKFKEGNFNTIEFACQGNDWLGDIVDKEYYVYVQRNYNNDFSDNIGTNILYEVTAEKKDVPDYFSCSECKSIVTVKNL